MYKTSMSIFSKTLKNVITNLYQ